MENLRNVCIAIIGPSGVGKSTLISKIVEIFPHMKLSVSCTTRAPGTDEIEGVNYFFLSKQEFLKRKCRGDFAEINPYSTGNLYGTLKSECDISEHSVIFDIDVNGANELRRQYSDIITIFISPPNRETLKNRLEKRGRDSVGDIEKRLVQYEYESNFADSYDYHLINDDLNTSLGDLAGIIYKERGGILVAIDGTAGSGKGSHAKQLAVDMKGYHLDSGLIYRKLVYFCDILHQHRPDNKEVQVILDEFVKHYSVLPLEDDLLFRSKSVNEVITSWSSIPAVRETVFFTQLAAAYGHDHPVVVAEGRDMTTHVFRMASHKLYIDCGLEERAKRRAQQFGGEEQNHLISLKKRDYEDMTRELHPLYFDKANGVIKVFTNLPFQGTNARIKQYIGYEQQLV